MEKNIGFHYVMITQVTMPIKDQNLELSVKHSTNIINKVL